MPLSTSLILHEIIDFQLLARVNKQSPLASETAISLRTLLNYPLALNQDNSGLDLLNELKKYGDPIVFTTHNYGVSQQMVYDNMAVSFAVKVNNYLPYYFNNSWPNCQYSNQRIAAIPCQLSDPSR